jgi:peptidoglycan hydrolase CwlO-like protein
MKKAVFFIFLLLAFGAGIFFFTPIGGAQAQELFSYAPCRNPVSYKIGSIDQRFGLSREVLLTYLQEAESAWETQAGRDLFVYDPHAELTVNLVYDKRQDLNNQISDLRSEVEEKKNSLKPEIAAYEERSARFQERVKNLNEEVARYNSEGGAPTEEYKRLIAEQKALQEEADALNAEAKRLNLTSDSFAAKVDELNKTVTTFNSELEIRPEEGLFDPNTNTISIYFHTNKTELVHTLAHELGHARGLGHVGSEDALMYAQVNDQITPTQDDLSALQEVCRTRSWFEVVRERMQLLYELYANR